MKAYVATVQLLIVADSVNETYDAVSAILGQADIGLKDWAYFKYVDAKGNECFLEPREVLISDKDYVEGEFLDA